MRVCAWLSKNAVDLSGKRVAITGSTGGLGRALCRHLAALGASLVLLDRNASRSEAHAAALRKEFKSAVQCITADMEDTASVRSAAAALTEAPLDVLILNAGAYAVPRHTCACGYDNVFTINFLSPYLLVRLLLPHLRACGGRVVAVSSIAHDYAKADANDVDFSTRKRASLVYGNAKRYLTYALAALFEGESAASLAITHPGITPTGITAHYPRVIYALIKYPMRVIFMRPRKAALSLLAGVLSPTAQGKWIGPRLFGIWGFPREQVLNTASAAERTFIADTAERLYAAL